MQTFSKIRQKICQSSHKRLCIFLTAIGPGLLVMLADSDAGSIITAAQSGALWGYKLLGLQILLIPVLYITQELTVRLGLVTGCGYSELIKQHFGVFWAWIAVGTLIICCIGAIITELSGIASVGCLFGLPIWLSMLITVGFLLALVWTKSYNSVERIALVIGAFELVYLIVAWQAQPLATEIIHDLTNWQLHNSNYLYLCAANIGAVIMPWMIFYQQSAVVDKGLTVIHLNAARIDTAVGAIVTQIIMATVIIAIAATLGKSQPGQPLESVQQISAAITPFLGYGVGKVLFALGMLGASLIATIVVSLSAAWSIGEITGCRHSLQDNPKEAPWFYGIYCGCLLFSALIITSKVHLVNLNVAIEVMNALLLPIVLGFLFALARKALPDKYRLTGWYAIIVGCIFIFITGFSLIAGILGTICRF